MEMARSVPGIARKTSMTRIVQVIHLAAIVAGGRAIQEPAASESTMVSSPTDRDIRAPNIMRIRISRPSWSVPNGCAALGV